MRRFRNKALTRGKRKYMIKGEYKEENVMDFFEQMEARIPHGKVRTRFAPSPTGYMHVGNLRTAL